MKKILVLDDDAEILTLVEMTLRIHHYDVQAISRWEEVYDSIQNFQPDLLLMDISLNGADGRDICKQIKEQLGMQHLPVILFSAMEDNGSFIHECGAQAFLAKPYELDKLLGTIHSYVLEKTD
jgi:DNA-binding response OmpR family regulator